MTIRQIYKALLVELSKVNAPSLLLEDFNYFLRKAIYQYLNKRYGVYDISQQTTDDLRALKTTALLNVEKSNSFAELDLPRATYAANLPSDYFHLLNCICIYRIKENYKCYKQGAYARFPAKRLTSDALSTIIDDYYNRPLPKRPYFFVSNVANTDKSGDQESSDQGTSKEDNSNLPKVILLQNLYQKSTEDADSSSENSEEVPGAKIEIEYGDDSIFILEKVLVDYLKAPQDIQLTREQLDSTVDRSQTLEFSEYVCHQIINELVMLVMENISDPRLPSNIQVTQSIVPPAQQQTQ